MESDFSSLNRPVSSEERAAYKKKFYAERTFFGLTYLSVSILLIVSELLLYAGASVYAYASSQHIGGIILMAIGLIPLAAIVRTIQTYHARLNRSIKAYRFALSQGLSYEARIKDPIRKGIVFSDPKVKGSFIYDLISAPGGRAFEIGNYYYQVGSGDNQTLTSRYFGFISIALNKKLPHIVLDTTAQSIKLPGVKLSSFGVPFAKDQVLKLEGDFNDYFTLYVPTGYEADALYIFTPDLMARFIDNAGTYSAEIIDDRLYIYSGRPFFLDNPATYEKLFAILSTIGAKTLKQTKNYSDTQAEVKHEVAAQGRRLRKGLSVGIFLFVGVIIVAIVIANAETITRVFR